MYPSVARLGLYQAGNYRHPASVTTLTNNAMPPHIYQTPLGTPPPRLHRNPAQYKRIDATPVPWPPVRRQDQFLVNKLPVDSIQPRRHHSFDANVTLATPSTNCSWDVCRETYPKEDELPPENQVMFTRVKQLYHQCNRGQKQNEEMEYEVTWCEAMERGVMERYEEWLGEWAAGLKLPPFNAGSFSPSNTSTSTTPSNASTNAASSGDSVAGDQETTVVSPVGSNEEVEVNPGLAGKRQKDITDITWAFGGLPQDDDIEFCMTHVLQPFEEFGFTEAETPGETEE